MTILGFPHAPPHKILLLSCMDLRLLDEIVAFMDSIGNTNQYDQVILAGASLGASYEGLPHWGQTFWDHLDLARELHNVKEVYLLEHRECGAYRKLLGLSFGEDHQAETQAHTDVAAGLKTQIHVRHPDLLVRGFLMDLNGGVIELAI